MPNFKTKSPTWNFYGLLHDIAAPINNAETQIIKQQPYLTVFTCFNWK